MLYFSVVPLLFRCFNMFAQYWMLFCYIIIWWCDISQNLWLMTPYFYITKTQGTFCHPFLLNLNLLKGIKRKTVVWVWNQVTKKTDCASRSHSGAWNLALEIILSKELVMKRLYGCWPVPLLLALVIILLFMPRLIKMIFISG